PSSSLFVETTTLFNIVAPVMDATSGQFPTLREKVAEEDEYIPLTITQTVTTAIGSVVTITTVLSMIPSSSSDGICSTFIMCNPTQFRCPVKTSLPSQLAQVVEKIISGKQVF